MTNLSEARKALESMAIELSDGDTDCILQSAIDLQPHLGAILQCLQDAEPPPEAPIVRAW